MASFTTYAERATADSLPMKLYQAGIRKTPPGMLLKDILLVSGGRYEGVIDFAPSAQDHLRRVATVAADPALARIADLGKVTVSLTEFVGADPETTRITFGFRVDVTPEESAKLGLDHQGPYDPRTTLKVTSHQ